MARQAEIKDLNKSPQHLLRRAAQYASDVYAAEVGSKGLTHRQFAVMLAIEQNEGVSQTTLVEITGIDRSTLAELVSRLVGSGMVQRRRTRQDARVNTLRLSAAGRRALQATQPGAKSADQLLLKALSKDQRKEFAKALSDINQVLIEQENRIAETAKRKSKL
ncbi:MAG: MarR family winged helix-turn-helix transcriptional regulator [Hyphomicrobiales bacterium]